MRRIVPMIVDKFDPLQKKYELTMADFGSDYCRGVREDYPGVVFTFKLHDVDIRLFSVTV